MANWFAGEPKEQLAGKTAVVMGGGSGIGKATAQALCAAGANVMVAAFLSRSALTLLKNLRQKAARQSACSATAPSRATLTQCSPRPLKNSVASTW